MSAAAPLVVSRVLGRRLDGRYRVDAVLATGGMGAVLQPGAGAVATFPPERMGDARALVEDLWEFGQAAGISDHHVYAMPQNGYVHVVMGPSESMMAPDRSPGAADTRIPLP